MYDKHNKLAYACTNSFNSFATAAFTVLEPGTEFQWNWHLGCIAEHLEASFNGELPKLLINMPPRTLKSVMVAQLYTAWLMGKEPHHTIIGASYAHSLAERNVMRARQVMLSDWYKSIFPNTQISYDQNQKDFFTTSRAGQYKGTGIGGTVTGFGCQTLIGDDILNPVEASSDTIRQSVMREVRSTLFSRFNLKSQSKFILIMQRLHEADPTGEFLRDGGYHLLKLPAEAKTSVLITLKDKKWEMEPGDLLTPRLTKNDLNNLITELGEANYVGQYLQEPVPIGGGEFKVDRVQRYRNGSLAPRTMNVAILVDPSGGEQLNKKKKKLSDFTAYMVVGLAPDNNRYLLDIIRDRLNPTERVEMLFILHRKWNELCGKPPKVGYEKYSMQDDIFYINRKMSEDSYHFPVIEVGGQQIKEDRIRRLIPDLENMRWYFPDTMMYVDGQGRQIDLIKELVESEMANFPRSKFDDMLDALSRVYEPDLNMVFPQLKKTMTEKAIDSSIDQTESWENF